MKIWFDFHLTFFYDGYLKLLSYVATWMILCNSTFESNKNTFDNEIHKHETLSFLIFLGNVSYYCKLVYQLLHK